MTFTGATPMTTRDTQTQMEAGREMDVLIAERVMGWRRVQWATEAGRAIEPGWMLVNEIDWATDHYRAARSDELPSSDFDVLVPRYSTDIPAAWPVLEKLMADFNVELRWDGRRWTCCVIHPFYRGHAADTAPLAICRAALAATGTDRITQPNRRDER
jgi:hypothetical protein